LSDIARLLYSGSGSRESFFCFACFQICEKTLDVHEDSLFRKEYEHDPDPEWLCVELGLVPFTGYGAEKDYFPDVVCCDAMPRIQVLILTKDCSAKYTTVPTMA